MLGIPKDCYKYKTKMSARNALNPIWEDTFELEVRLPELAFLRFTVVDIATGAATAQRVVPLRQLRPGYRNVALWDLKGNRLPLSSLFILSVFHPDSVPRDHPTPDSLSRKRMSFLLIHDVGEQDPYAILKVTSESTTREVIKMALEKVGQGSKLNEFVLLEQVGKDVESHQQRLVGMEEIPLSVRSQWKADGRFVLKRVGEDPSWRARLGTSMINPASRRVSALVPAAEAEEEEEADNFLVCIFNVSPGVAHTILQVSKAASALQVIAAALAKSRSRDDPRAFVLIEETTVADARKKGGKKMVQRLLADDENVYLVQTSWRGNQGKLTLLERDKNVFKTRGLVDTHPGVRETQSEPIYRVGSPRVRRSNNLVGRVRKFSRSLYGTEDQGLQGIQGVQGIQGLQGLQGLQGVQGLQGLHGQQGAVSDGDFSDEDEEAKGRKPSIANFRKLKIW